MTAPTRSRRQISVSWPEDWTSLERLKSGKPEEISRPLWKKIGSLGYALTKWIASRPAALRYIAKHNEFAELTAWIGDDSALHTTALAGDGLFATLLEKSDSGVTAAIPFLEQGVVSRLTALLPASLKARAPALSKDALHIPADAGAPVWSALLRLRPLRDFWERELRRNHWETLTALLPDAWLFDPISLPPQAVIPRLNLAGWEDLADLHQSGRSFALKVASRGVVRLSLAESESADMWRTTVNKVLSAPDGPLVMEEQPGRDNGGTLVAVYHHTPDRVEMSALLALDRDADEMIAAEVLMKK